MVIKNKLSKKMIAIILAVVLVVSTFPVGFASAFAAQPECLAVNVNSKKVYFYGAKALEVNEDNSVSFTTDVVEEEQTTATVYVGGTEIVDSQITATINSVSFGSWLESQNDWVAVKCVSTAQIPTDEPNVDVDETAPEITGVLGNPSEWTKNDVTLTIEAKDNKGGTGVVAYGINQEDGIKWQSEAKFNITENGTYMFYVKDAVGNISEKYEINVEKIDKIDPIISSVSVAPDSWTNNSVVFKVNVSDTDSGLAEKAYKIDDDEWQQSNEFTVSDSNEHTFSVRDSAGNIAKTSQKADKHDVVKPVISDVEIKWGLAPIGRNKFTSSQIDYNFYVKASDDKSGVAKYSNDGKNWQDENKFTLKGAGNYTFYVKDNAGNVSDVYAFTLGKDEAAPTINSIIPDVTTPTNKTITITVDAVDNESGAGITGNAYKIDEGKWQSSNRFAINDCKEHTIYVRDSANPENVAEEKFRATNFNDGTPKISAINSTNDKNKTKWMNSAIQVKVFADSTKNSVGTEFAIKEYGISDGANSNIKWQESNVFEITDCKVHYFYVMDCTDKISESSIYTADNFDNNDPILDDDKQNKAVTFESKYDTKIYEKLNDILNFLGFGNFFNEKLKITVKAADDAVKDKSNASGIVSAKFVFKDAVSQSEYTYEAKDVRTIGNKEKAAITFEVGNLPNNFKGTAFVTLTDAAGNTSKTDVTTDNSNFGDGRSGTAEFMLENDHPNISPTSTECISKTSYNFKFSVTDEFSNSNYSGLAFVKVYANDVEVFSEDYQGESQIEERPLPEKKYSLHAVAKSSQDDEKSYTVNGMPLKDKEGNDKWNNGKITYRVETCDNSGNYSDFTSKEYSFDQTSPIITKFEIGSNNADKIEAHESYGFYFKEATKVTITADDIINSDNREAVASGVASITAYLEDVDGSKYIVPENGAEIEKLTEDKDLEAVTVDKDNSISFVIPANFKGQIYAYATDNVGNSPKSCEYFLDKTDKDNDGYANPDGSIVENADKHIEKSSIKFTMPSTSSTQNTKFAGFSQEEGTLDSVADYEEYLKSKSSSNVPLYNNNFKANIAFSDSYSGINTIKLTVIEGDNSVAKTVKFDNDGNNISEDNVAYEIVKKDSNLVTDVVVSDFAVQGNYNDMVLVAELTDNSGNVSYDYYAFGIDKTAPQITVSYDNNNADTKSGSGAFFNANRTATITVKERNFNTENVEWTIRNAEGTAPSHSAPKFTQGSGNRDDDTYVYTVTYSNDGVYSFDMKYTDRAGNKNQPIDYGNSVAPTKFVVDKTMPVINVSYDNNDARNEKYFNAYRTATVTVTEHNFDVNRVTITGTASLDGNAVKFPDASWSNSGDTHVATIKYDTDADYTFDISMDDMAGNKSNEANYGSSVAPKDFVVDTTIDKPVISGVENGNSYKDSVLPKIDFSDINFKDVKVTLLRTRKDEINKDVTSDYINVSTNDKGGSFAATEDTFKKIQENDGIYTLSVQITDKAENTSSDEVTFTVNRFGSVYSLGAYLSNDLNDKYVQSIDNDIVITEYNPDRLVEGNLDVVVTRDGSPVEYGDGELTISPVVNELAKIGSSGWYQYEYTISKNVFTDDNGNPIDGIYKVYVGSEDTVGNKSENISYDESSVLFRLDHTAPTIKSVSGLDKKIVNADEQKVSYEVFDAIGIDSIDVYYYDGNGTRVDHIRSTDNGSTDVTDILSDLTNYTGSFTIGSSTTSEPVRIVIKDLAGNVTDTDSKDFDIDSIDFNRAITVSTNFFVRWFANKIVFGCSIAAIIAVGGGLAFFIAIRKRRKDEAITEEIKKKARGSKD